MDRMRKVIQRKIYYVCRCCKRERAVIVALHRPVVRQTFNYKKGGYDIHGYSPYPSKILFCLKCGTLDLRGKMPHFIRKAYKMWPYWKNKFSALSLRMVRGDIAKLNNIKKARQFDEEKAARESSVGNGNQEGVSAEVRESFTSDGKPVLRV